VPRASANAIFVFPDESPSQHMARMGRHQDGLHDLLSSQYSQGISSRILLDSSRIFVAGFLVGRRFRDRASPALAAMRSGRAPFDRHEFRTLEYLTYQTSLPHPRTLPTPGAFNTREVMPPIHRRILHHLEASFNYLTRATSQSSPAPTEKKSSRTRSGFSAFHTMAVLTTNRMFVRTRKIGHALPPHWASRGIFH